MTKQQLKAVLKVLKSYNRKQIPVKYMGIDGISIDKSNGFLMVSWTQLCDYDDKYGNTLEFYEDITECYKYDTLNNKYIFDGGY
jgi:hypothetical protein